MLKLFCPNYYIHSYRALTASYLKEHGITMLLCDIDNTMVAHDEPLPDRDVHTFVESMKNAGIRIVFISNNVEERVQRFVSELDVAGYSFAMKPLPKTYRRIVKDFALSKEEVAVLGDQLLTDMLGANLMGFYTILSAPVVERDLSFTKFNRFFEAIIFRLLKLSGRLTKGEFDD